jgi:MFS family permease
MTNLGDWLTYVAVTSFAANRADPASALGFVVLGQTLPRALLAPIAGRLADRFDRRAVYVAAELVRGLLALGMAYFSEHGEIGTVLWLHAARGGVGAVSDTAMRSALPTYVPSRELEAVNRRLGTLWSVAFVMGVLGGGVLVAESSPCVAFVVDGITFFVGAAAWLTLGKALPEAHEPSNASYASRSTEIPIRTYLRAPLALVHGAAFVLTAAHPKGAIVAPLAIGLLHGGRAVGNAIGAELGNRRSMLFLATPIGMAGVLIAVYGSAPPSNAAVAPIGAVLWGLGMGATYTFVTTTLQVAVPRRVLGKAMARDTLAFTLAWAVGAIAAGVATGPCHLAPSSIMLALAMAALGAFGVLVAGLRTKVRQ